MSSVIIPSANLDLILQTPDEALAWVESLPPADRAEVSPDWIARVRTTVAGDPWALSYTAVERSTGTTVGGCAFKGPPVDGIVEVAYGIDEAHRGKGFATEAAGAMTEFAFASGQVQTVRAHTKPENGASGRALAENRFRQIGEVIDPEDGLVTRWERDKADQ